MGADVFCDEERVGWCSACADGLALEDVFDDGSAPGCGVELGGDGLHFLV